ncbi:MULTISPECIES: phenylalanine--tRNA ligase subunit alpha [Candidatus Nitrosocaldus]|jgi:phenylalanyl-tRNA synthetase alpha chain|uniref:phenylalanine--tRNA ligase n=1 Tax=Candidatus Nitrosocaldus cavascurensis TaxID=2058097 RepID=A0A2K5ASP1_9ARCH|nr:MULTISPECIES: phenylalanine--tRNA ligase subunit alpha [Candidatus Nitrosocaldus]SPC34629.1 Phenylalanine--tRNA ligase alpha chain [Candidatus Nitrosocaldus cavascurensis]
MLIALHDIERRIILALAGKKGWMGLDELSKHTGLNIDQVRRGVEWLKYKGIISMEESTIRLIGIGREGLNVLKSNLPEIRLVSAAIRMGGEGVSLKDVREVADLADDEFNAAVRYAREKGLITLSNGKVYVRKSVDAQNMPEYRLLARLGEKGWLREDELSNDDKDAYRMLKSRPEYIVERDVREVRVMLSEHGYSILKQIMDEQERMEDALTVKRIDVTAPAPIIYAGRKHILQDVIDEVREILIGMGFEEIDGSILQSAFWNFDALFTPQDHPAREMQDTFYIASMRRSIDAEKEVVKRVSSMHEQGWRYSWSSKEAERLVLRTHTTAVTIRYLAEHKPDEASIFSVGRVFRNEKLSYKHLAEFHQVEGIVVSKDATLRDLMGIQQEFYRRLGLNKVKFWPTYFPYTEPSLQSMVYHERLGRWVELFGMGIFRPEVTEPLGIDKPVLAWGGGLERIAMLKYGIDDVRELYSNRLSMLRGVARCQL